MVGGENLEKLITPEEEMEKNEKGAVDVIVKSNNDIIQTATENTFPILAEKNKGLASAMIINNLEASKNRIITSAENEIYFDLFLNILENGTTNNGIDNLNALLFDNNINRDMKDMVFRGILENIKEKTEGNEAFIKKILDKKSNPKERQERADDILEDLDLKGLSVGYREMKHTIGSDYSVDLGKGWFPPHDPRNGGEGGTYNPNIFKNGWTNQSLADKPGYSRDRYFLVNENQEEIFSYNEKNIQKALQENTNKIPSNGLVSVDISEEFMPITEYDRRNQLRTIQNMLYVNNKVEGGNVTVNYVPANEVRNGVQINVTIPSQEEILGPQENVVLTTQFEKTKSNLDEGGRRQELIETFKEYLVQDEQGKRKLNTEKYKIFDINSIEGNASSIYDPNVSVEEAQKNNEQYALDRLNSAIVFLNDIGTPQEMINGAKSSSKVNYDRKDEADQNIIIDWTVQKVLQKAEPGRQESINIPMPSIKVVTWDVLHTRLSNNPKDDSKGIFGKIFG